MPEKILELYKISTELDFMLALAINRKDLRIPRDMDWAQFSVLVEKARIEPLIAHHASKLEDAADIPVLAGLIQKLPEYRLIAMQQIQHLAMIAKAFAANGIPLLSLKGPLLAMQIYGDPSLRFSRDLDLLVAEEQLEKACECLRDLGYVEEITIYNKTPLRRKLKEADGEEMHRVFLKGNICIELHWRISFRTEESFENLWINRKEARLLGQTVYTLGETDNVSYLISHAAGHGFHRLRWLLDIYELYHQNDFFWEEIWKYIRSGKALLIETAIVLARIPTFGIIHLSIDSFCIDRRECGVSVSCSKEINADVRKGIALSDAVYPILVNPSIANGLAGRKYQRMLPTLGRKHSILEVFRPSRADLELIDLPDSLYFLYYIIRPFHKLWRMLPHGKRSVKG